MKHIYILMLFIALCAAFGACATGGSKSSSSDEFIMDLDSPQIIVGEFEAQLVGGLLGIGSLKRETMTVLYFPLEDVVAVRFRADFMTYHQFWSRSGRQAFISALERYNQDYDARRLTSSRTSRRSYGVVQGHLIWQQFDFAVQASAGMGVELGYDFRDRAPYFTTYQREAVYKDPGTSAFDRVSQNIPMFFTRAQAAELAALFDQNNLRELSTGLPTGTGGVARDDDY